MGNTRNWVHRIPRHTRDQCFAPDFGLSQLFIHRFANSFQHNDGHVMTLHVRDIGLGILMWIFLIVIAAMEIAGEYENNSS